MKRQKNFATWCKIVYITTKILIGSNTNRYEMNIDNSHSLIVLVGAFNTQILRNPNWMKQYLFPESKQEQLEMKMNLEMFTEELTSVIEIDGIQIEVKSGRLAINPKELTPEYIDKVYDVLGNISATLPHTPMSAYGVNFCFIGESSKPFIWRKTNFDNFLLPQDKTEPTLEVKQQLQYEEHRVNFTISEKKASSQKYEERLFFNFHTPVNTSTKEAMDVLLKQRVIEQCMRFAEDHAKHVLNDK